MADIWTSVRSWFSGMTRYEGAQTPMISYAGDAAATVTWDTAMQLSGVWSCVKLLSETVASLPLTVYRVSDIGRKPHTTHPLTVLFSSKCNQYQTKNEFFETMISDLVVHGNAYAQIQRMGGQIVGLLPLMAAQMTTRLLADGSVVHEYARDDGVDVFAASSVWHLKLLGNGIVGLSPLAHQRNTLGIAQAAETAVTNIYANGAKPSGVLTMDRVLTKEQRDLVRSNFATLTTSTDNRLLVLEGGMKWEGISLSPQDIELLASRQWQLTEICRWYGVPSVLVNDTASTTVWGSGIEQIVRGFYQLTIRPLLEKIETSICANLLTEAERPRMDVEFDFGALLRTDQKSRYEAYRIGVQAGILTPNEARSAEGMLPMDGGDELYVQGAMVPLTQAGRKPDPAPATTQEATNGTQDPSL